MAASEPFDFLASWPGWSTRFALVPVSEISATRGGRQLARDLGPALWEADYVTKGLAPLALRRWKAVLARLEGGQATFIAWDMSAGWPAAYPDGAGLSGQTATLGAASGYDLSLTGLPAAAMKLTAGDYVAFGYGGSGARALHQVTADVTATAGAATLDVRPAVRPGWTNGATVTLRRPWCLMAMVPGTLSESADVSGRGTLAFTARQTL